MAEGFNASFLGCLRSLPPGSDLSLAEMDPSRLRGHVGCLSRRACFKFHVERDDRMHTHIKIQDKKTTQRCRL